MKTAKIIKTTLTISCRNEDNVTIQTWLYLGIHIHRGVKDDGSLERSGWTLSHNCGLRITYGIRFPDLVEAKRAARLHLAIAKGVLGRDKAEFERCHADDKKAMSKLNNFLRSDDWAGAEKHVIDHEASQGRARPILYTEPEKQYKPRLGNAAVTVSTLKGFKKTTGFIVDGWQIHKPYDPEAEKPHPGWDITHAPSGLRIFHSNSLPKAKKAVKILAAFEGNRLASLPINDFAKNKELYTRTSRLAGFLGAEDWQNASDMIT